MYRTMLTDVQRLQAEQYTTSQQVSTNRKVNLPSDSDYAVTILRSKVSLNEVDQYKVNLEASNSWMTASESAMQSIVDRLTRAQALAEQMSTGTYQSDQQSAAAAEVSNIIDQIISLANTSANGSYIFSGTRNSTPAITDKLVTPDPAALRSDGPSSHNTQASVYSSGGNSYLRLARQTGGAANTLALSPLSTLGTGLGLNFSAANFTQDQAASDTPLQGDIYTSNQALTAPTDLVSNRLGETLVWTGEGVTQTYVTTAKVSFGGAPLAGDTVTIGADVYTFAGPLPADATEAANWLAEQINGNAAAGYHAEANGGSVTLHAEGGGMYNVTSAGAAITTDDDTSLQEVVNTVNAGTRATGAIDLTALAAGDTVTVGGFTFTQGTDFTDAASLAAAINGTLASVTASTNNGNGVFLSARQAGDSGNLITLASTGGVVVSGGTLDGGLDGADNTGSLMGSGESTLRLSTTVLGEVTAVDAASGAVTMKLSWYDDNGQYQSTTATIPAGEGSAVSVGGLGGLKLYRDDKVYKLGAVFALDLIHYQGDDHEIAVNFSNGTRMAYNWTARQVLGDPASVNLDGGTATAQRQPLSTGNLQMSGVYSGLMSRDLTFDVIDGGQVPGDNVTFQVTWTDDQGLAHTKQVTASGAGSGNVLALPVFGDTSRISIDGDNATATPVPPNAGTGGVHITGTYQGSYSRDFSYTVTDGGQLPGDSVTIRATWTDEQGQAHSEDVSLSASGKDGAVEIPGSAGVKVYLDGGTYAAGDTYTYNLRLNPPHAGEAIYFNLDNGVFVAGDSFHYSIDKQPLSVLDTLKNWQYQLGNGAPEAAQTQSQRTLEAMKQSLNTIMDYIADSGTRQNRITVRENVLEEHVTYNSKNLEDLQDVDLTQAFMDLRAQQTAYDASLKVISVMSQMFLPNYMG
jgi:flagellar hook-associated protein 3 FlgL